MHLWEEESTNRIANNACYCTILWLAYCTGLADSDDDEQWEQELENPFFQRKEKRFTGSSMQLQCSTLLPPSFSHADTFSLECLVLMSDIIAHFLFWIIADDWRMYNVPHGKVLNFFLEICIFFSLNRHAHFDRYYKWIMPLHVTRIFYVHK